MSCHYNSFQTLMAVSSSILLETEHRYCGEASPQA